MPQRNLTILAVSLLVTLVCYVHSERNPYARYVSTGLATIEREALQQVPNRELFNGAMQGMVDVLRRHGDEHSQFLNESQAEPLKAEIRQQFGGIGVRIQFVGDPPRLTIIGPPDPGTPAARANLLPGDQILAIDDHPTSDMNMEDALRYMRGQPGESLRLTIRHAHEEQSTTVALLREVIHIDSILGDRRGADGKWSFRLASDPQIGFVRITSFGDRTADELADVLESLVNEGVAGVVLDLRDNPGGALEAAVEVCELLLPPGRAVVETRGRDQQVRERYVTTEVGRFRDLPLVVLVNQNSASAAEIVAACLQDHRRAAIAGQRTFGKGTVQQLVPLESGESLLKLTWASFWRPSGANIHRMPHADESGDWGVRPDALLERTLTPDEYVAYRRDRNARDAAITVDEATSVAVPPTDVQLQLAVEYLQKLLAKSGD